MKFEMPIIEVETFNVVDVITASAEETSSIVTTLGPNQLPIA